MHIDKEHTRITVYEREHESYPGYTEYEAVLCLHYKMPVVVKPCYQSLLIIDVSLVHHPLVSLLIAIVRASVGTG